MELRLIGQILLRWWWLVLIPTVIAAALAVPALLHPTVTGGYTETITYSAMQSPTAIPRLTGDGQDIWLASELVVNAFSEWVKDDRFKQEVAAIDPAADLSALGIASDNAHSVGQIYLSYPDASALQIIGAAVVQVLATRSQDYFPQLGGQPAAVTILGQTPVTPAPPPLADRFGVLIRVGLGLIAGIALAFLAHYLDPLLRRRADLEALGLPVLGAIPPK